jgi:flagellar biosynthetic protein FliR
MLLLPFVLVLGRTAAFVSTLPLLGFDSIPLQVRAGLAMVLSIFFAAFAPPPAVAAGTQMLTAGLMLGQEVLCGLALGLAARLVFLAVQQGGMFVAREMGFAMSFILDPSTGEESDPLAILVDTIFVLLFLGAGGLHVLVRLIWRSYEVIPLGGTVDWGLLSSALAAAGSAMLLMMLQLAAPVLAAFLILGVVLGVVARVLPEMDILMTSLPLRVAVGLVVATAMMPLLATFVDEVTQWIGRLM